MERKMSVKGFLAKSNSSKAMAGALGFLQAHREYLLTGEVAYATASIIEKFDNGELPATPALNEVKQAVLAHIMEVERIKSEEALEKSSLPSVSKPYLVEIRDAATNAICIRVKDDGTSEKLVKGFSMPQDAERWADRRLFDGAPSWFGTVTQTNAKNPEHATDIIERDDSIARILKRPRATATKTVNHGSSSLGFGVKVREKHTNFSHG